MGEAWRNDIEQLERRAELCRVMAVSHLTTGPAVVYLARARGYQSAADRLRVEREPA
jgi:hypothetical protein